MKLAEIQSNGIYSGVYLMRIPMANKYFLGIDNLCAMCSVGRRRNHVIVTIFDGDGTTVNQEIFALCIDRLATAKEISTFKAKAIKAAQARVKREIEQKFKAFE